VGLSLHEGEVLWRQQLGIQQITSLTVTDRAIALGGVHGLGTDAHNARVTLLDPITGDRLVPAIDQGRSVPPFWLGVLGDRVVAVAPDLVQAYNLVTGESLWQHEVPDRERRNVQYAREGWGQGNTVALMRMQRQNGRIWPWQLSMMDVATGDQRGTVPVNEPPLSQSMRMLGSRLYLATPSRAQAINGDGTFAWRDAINMPAKTLTAQTLTQDQVAIVAQSGEQQQPPETVGLYVLERETGRLKASFDLLPAMKSEAWAEGGSVTRVRCVAGGVALGNDDQTILLPGSQ
jgi:outer membrane protein assembly factor BamB